MNENTDNTTDGTRLKQIRALKKLKVIVDLIEKEKAVGAARGKTATAIVNVDGLVKRGH